MCSSTLGVPVSHVLFLVAVLFSSSCVAQAAQGDLDGDRLELRIREARGLPLVDDDLHPPLVALLCYFVLVTLAGSSAGTPEQLLPRRASRTHELLSLPSTFPC